MNILTQEVWIHNTASWHQTYYTATNSIFHYTWIFTGTLFHCIKKAKKGVFFKTTLLPWNLCHSGSSNRHNPTHQPVFNTFSTVLLNSSALHPSYETPSFKKCFNNIKVFLEADGFNLAYIQGDDIFLCLVNFAMFVCGIAVIYCGRRPVVFNIYLFCFKLFVRWHAFSYCSVVTLVLMKANQKKYEMYYL